MKTLEFKLTLNNAQRATIDRWLEAQRRLWNWGLELLIEFDRFSAYNKQDKTFAPCCPLPWEYKWLPLTGDTEWRDPAIVNSLPKKDKTRTNYLPVPYSVISSYDRFCCPLPLPYRTPRIKNDSFFGITPYFAYKLHPEKTWLTSCPYKITQSTLKELTTAWTEFKKGKRDQPRFKSAKKNPLRTLSNIQAGEAKLRGNDRVKLPGLSSVLVRGVDERFTAETIATYRIVKEPSGYYLMLVGKIDAKPSRVSSIQAGLDAGLVHLLTDDDGKHIEFPASLGKRLEKLKLLQQKASRQAKGSANQRKTYKAVARIHEKIRRERKAYSHKVTTYAVRKYGSIAVEALKLQNMTKAPKAKPSEDGTHYEPNGAAAKAGLNRKILDAGFGQLFTMLETKCQQHDRIFEKVPPQYTSQKCNNCGHVDSDNRPKVVSQAEFKCVQCGHTNNADVNAAQNIRDIAFPRGVYPSLVGEVKPAFVPKGSQQEASTVQIFEQISLAL